MSPAGNGPVNIKMKRGSEQFMQGMQGFTYIDLAVLIVYLLAVLFAGLHFAKKEMKGKNISKNLCRATSGEQARTTTEDASRHTVRWNGDTREKMLPNGCR